MNTFTKTLEERIATVSRQDLDFCLCHGDMDGNNNVFQQEHQFIHYDFEWAAKGWRAYDLAQVKVRKRQSDERKTDIVQSEASLPKMSRRLISLLSLEGSG